MTKFIAVDGEADAQGRYIIMCDSTGGVLHNPNGIPSSEAFEFLLRLSRHKAEVVCFGLNYDANQWIKDLPRGNLERLARENRTTWRAAYKVEWIPSKMFTIVRPGASVTVSEVFGFFQTSFVKALQQWGFEPPAEIERMKKRRGTFTQKELDRVIAYCREECRLLVSLMDRLQAACAEADCVPRRRWIGAGSIASALLTKHRTREVHAYDVDLFGTDLTDAYVLRAYFGGRVELYQQGYQKKAISTDIRSAYPAAAMQLPSLAGASVQYVKNDLARFAQFNKNLYGLWRVSWQVPPMTQIGPFPVRLPHGDICYPLEGEGVYHAVEVRAALASCYNVTIHDGVIVEPTPANPFRWIADVYKVRERFKNKGDYAEKALKLGLNSIYGKFAQGYGFGRRPPFQSYFWAGYITACTRARMLHILNHARTPIMAATDGAVMLNVSTPSIFQGNGIGSWEESTYDRVATIQPGVYVAENNGNKLVKSRGFFARDVDYDQLIDDFYADPSSCHHFTSRRFIGLKVALHRKDFGVWRQWIEERRSIAFEIRNKISIYDPDGNVYLYPIKGPFSSLPYEPKQSLYDDPSDDQLENMVRDDQPHREVD